MKKIAVDSLSIISSLGRGSEVNFDALLKGISGVRLHVAKNIDENPVFVSLVNNDQIDPVNKGDFTRYEMLLINSIEEAVKNSTVDLTGSDTLFIYSTTKGNIALLEDHEITPELVDRMSLFRSAELVTAYFGNKNQPVVISNACISGVVALLYARRMLLSGAYKHAVVTGADTITRFVYSGFQSFQALSPGHCKPFSASRDGINLGEAGATIILTAEDEIAGNKIYIEEGNVSNDSNHISGPSRTGEELSEVINKSIEMSGIKPQDIDFISAHGTATPFNDEMEAKAFQLSGLHKTPVNSLKGYFGHTLGAAGIVESAISIMSLQKGMAIPSLGYSDPPVNPELNIITAPYRKEMKYCLKTASGFGGCNAAIVFSRN